jgi:Pentapeptide repeats (8 copies)
MARTSSRAPYSLARSSRAPRSPTGRLARRGDLQGASLASAQLQGASLDAAKLQGVPLDHAQLQGASFVDACVWRADARLAAWKDTVARQQKGPKADKIDACDWTWASFEALKQLIAEDPESVYGRLAMERIDQGLTQP